MLRYATEVLGAFEAPATTGTLSHDLIPVLTFPPTAAEERMCFATCHGVSGCINKNATDRQSRRRLLAGRFSWRRRISH